MGASWWPRGGFRALEPGSAHGKARGPNASPPRGITDRHAWVPIWNKRGDGLPNRPLPLDADSRPKPPWNAIDDYCNK